MTGLSLAEVSFLALGTAGFARFGWCLVYLIADEEPLPAWLDKALDVAVGAYFKAHAAASRFSLRDAEADLAALLILTIPTGSHS
ncbi:hypothetical protein [Streptomyces sp. B21-083]|uniref:hypothetical protein n=1 Tax=Streptomyces sp. B21-083 TaxID=3039410 RepID=UPI002FF0C3E3